MLTIQYRMHELISSFSSQTMYENKLICDDSVKYHNLSELFNVDLNNHTIHPLTLIDTCVLDEQAHEDIIIHDDEDGGDRTSGRKARLR